MLREAREESLWKYKPDSKDTHLTVKRAQDARSNTIGASYRLHPDIVHMHAALNEVGAIYVSATVHEGWSKAAVKNGIITQSEEPIGGHAFAIVGYDEKGFWIQHSWGPGWGRNGLAHWSYEDWQDNVSDAWVIRLALPTPQFWGGRHEGAGAAADKSGLFGPRGPRRDEIAGHFVHIDDGQFHEEGKYWSTRQDIDATAGLIAKSEKYDRLLFYAHGGLNSTSASATRIAVGRAVPADRPRRRVG